MKLGAFAAVVAWMIAWSMLLGACGRVGFEPIGSDGAVSDTKSGLIGWWKLDETNGSTATDGSGFGNDGILSAGMTWTTGQVDGAVQSDGLDNHTIDLGNPTALKLVGSMTLAAWVSPTAFHLGDGFDDVIVGYDDNNGSDRGWSLKGSEDCAATEHWVLQIATSPSTYAACCSATIPVTGRWYHVAAVYDATAGTMNIYVNGVLDNGMALSTPPFAQHIAATNVHAQIGDTNPHAGNSVGGANGFTGVIDDVRIYERALSARDVSALAGN